MNICTIVAKNYLAHARMLSESFKEYHPDGTCYVLIIDDVEGYIDPTSEPFELVAPAQLGIEDYEHMAAIYDVLELSTAVKPWLLAHLLNERGLERIAHLDPDIRIYDRLGRLDELTREHELVLTPHVTTPIPRDDKKPSEADMLIAGTYNLGFIALERTPRTGKLLDWWSERLKTDCVVAPELGYFVDQRWIDLVHSVVPGFYVLDDPSYNVAYWNLHGRELTYEKGRYYVNGEPLQFFHFSGFNPHRRDRLSKYQNRIEFGRGSALARICNEYANALLAHGYEKTINWPYTYGTMPNGIKLDSGMHRLYRTAAKSGELKGSIFTLQGANGFVAWLNEPAPVGAEYGVTRYLYEIYSRRPDLRQRFPNLDGPDAADFIEWAQTLGGAELPLAKHPAAEGNADLRQVLQNLDGPKTADSLEWNQTHKGAEPPFARNPETEGNEHPLAVSPTGVNVAGYFRSEMGVGEVARQMTAALESQNIPVATVGVSSQHYRQGYEYETDKTEPTFPINLFCVNADSLPGFVSQAPARLFENRYSVGMWWWEVSEFPERFAGSFKYLDEVWVGSHHVADALTGVSPIPVVKVTMPVSMPEIKKFDRQALGLPKGFLFLFIFDYNSVFERKNPLATIEAFKRAFPPGSAASLVLKSINSNQHPEEHERLLSAAENHPDVHVIDHYVSVEEKNAMIAVCDCCVSLHRSEGFGITLAETMYLGKPVIATAYSGNLDFMTDRNSYLVDYELRPIGNGSEPYPATGEWADPNIEHAASLMRRVFDDPGEARQRGKRAAKDIRRTHSPEAAGQVMARRLKHIEERLGTRAGAAERSPTPRPSGLHAKRLEQHIAHTPRPVPSGSLPGRIVGLARRVLLKLIWPFAMQQRTVNDQLLATIKSAYRRLEAQNVRREAQHAKNHAEVLGWLRQLDARSGESRVLPYVAYSPFEVFEDPTAGRVQGYTGSDGTTESVGAYETLEDIFRGSEQFIRDRQRRYLDLLGDREPVLNVGCGRGEFLDLLRDRRIEYAGVDADPGMVERCRKEGHEQVELAGANSYLERCEDGSIGVIFCAHLIERLPYEELLRFCELSERKLKPGGLFIAEMINPHAEVALKTFWMNPTRQHPILPEAALALCRSSGFESAYVFHPNGKGDVETDRYETGEYAVVATKAVQKQSDGDRSGHVAKKE